MQNLHPTRGDDKRYSVYRRIIAFRTLRAAWRNEFTDSNPDGNEYIDDYVNDTITVRCRLIDQTLNVIHITHTDDDRDAVRLSRQSLMDFVYAPLDPDARHEPDAAYGMDFILVMPQWLARRKAKELKDRKEQQDV